MSNLVKNAAVLALLTNDVHATKLIQKSMMSLEDLKPTQAEKLVESKGIVAQSFATADTMELDDQPINPYILAAKNKKMKTNSWAQDFADEYEKEDIDGGQPHEIQRLSMTDINAFSTNLLHPAGKLEQDQQFNDQGKFVIAPPTTYVPQNQKPQVIPDQQPVEQKPKDQQIEQQQPPAAPIEQPPSEIKSKDLPQSGTPISDVIIGGLKKISGKDDGQTAQVSSNSNDQDLPQSGTPISDVTISGLKAASGNNSSNAQVDVKKKQAVEAKVNDKNTDESLYSEKDTDFMKYSEGKSEKYGSDLNTQTVKAPQAPPKEEPKKEEIKKEQQPVANTTKPAEVVVDQKTKSKDEIKQLVKEADQDEEAQIQKVAATVKTDEEIGEQVLKDVKYDHSEQLKEITKEMGQLKPGEFDSMLSSGQAAYPEALHKEQAPKPPSPPPVTALTKVAQNLGENIKPKSLDLADLKSAQAQIQQMINTMEQGNQKPVAEGKK